MSKFKRWMILVIVSSALLLIVMDMTILYTALPSLTHDLGASASEKLWILTLLPCHGGSSSCNGNTRGPSWS